MSWKTGKVLTGLALLSALVATIGAPSFANQTRGPSRRNVSDVPPSGGILTVR